MALTSLNPNLLGTDSAGASKLSTAGGLVQLHSTGVFTIANTSANSVFISNTGPVGIGTSTPDSSNKLEVSGDLGLSWADNKFLGMKYVSGTSYKMGLMLNSTTRECKVWSQSSDSDDKITMYTGSTPTERMRIDSNGNVGIGGAANNDGGYGRCLQITGTEAALELKAGNDFSYVAQNGANLQIRNNAAAGAMTFSTVSTERARIDSTGRLAIGGVGDQYGLVTINGGLANNSGSVYGLYMKGNGSSTSCPIYFNGEHGYPQKSIYQEGYYMKIRGHNNEGIWFLGSYASSDPSVNYKFNGLNNGSTCYNAQNSSSWNTTSDRRVKTNIQPLSTALDKIMQLQPVTFDYTDEFASERGWWLVDEEGNQTTLNPTRQLNNIGFIAQDYKNVFPEDVSISKEKVLDTEYEDFHTLNPDNVVPHLVKAIQELNAKFEEYKASHP